MKLKINTKIKKFAIKLKLIDLIHFLHFSLESKSEIYFFNSSVWLFHPTALLSYNAISMTYLDKLFFYKSKSTMF